MICICKDDTSKFVANQYLHYFARKNDCTVKPVEEIIQAKGSKFGSFENILYKYECEELNEFMSLSSNIWIICDKVSKEVKKELDDNIVSIPKLEEWQIKDYITSISELTEDQANNIINFYKDIVKVDIELKKLTIFKSNMYEELIDQIIFNEERPIFDITDALIKRDKNKLSAIIKDGIDDIEPYALLAILIKNMKLVIDIQLAKNPTAESVGISSKQFWAVSKYSCNHYTRDELIYLYDMLTGIDLKIKTGGIDTSNVVNFIISKFLGFMR